MVGTVIATSLGFILGMLLAELVVYKKENRDWERFTERSFFGVLAMVVLAVNLALK